MGEYWFIISIEDLVKMMHANVLKDGNIMHHHSFNRMNYFMTIFNSQQHFTGSGSTRPQQAELLRVICHLD